MGRQSWPQSLDRAESVEAIAEIIVQHFGIGPARQHRATGAAVAIYDRLVSVWLRATAAQLLRDEAEFLPAVEPHLQPGLIGLIDWLTIRAADVDEGRG